MGRGRIGLPRRARRHRYRQRSDRRSGTGRRSWAARHRVGRARGRPGLCGPSHALRRAGVLGPAALAVALPWGDHRHKRQLRADPGSNEAGEPGVRRPATGQRGGHTGRGHLIGRRLCLGDVSRNDVSPRRHPVGDQPRVDGGSFGHPASCDGSGGICRRCHRGTTRRDVPDPRRGPLRRRLRILDSDGTDPS